MDFPFEGIPTVPPRKDMDHMAFFCGGCRWGWLGHIQLCGQGANRELERCGRRCHKIGGVHAKTGWQWARRAASFMCACHGVPGPPHAWRARCRYRVTAYPDWTVERVKRALFVGGIARANKPEHIRNTPGIQAGWRPAAEGSSMRLPLLPSCGCAGPVSLCAASLLASMACGADAASLSSPANCRSGRTSS